MKKLMVTVLSLVMLLSVIGAASAEEVTLLTGGNGTISTTDLDGYETLTITVTADDPNVTNNYWGIGGLGLDGTWSITTGYEATSNGDVDQTFEWSVDDILADATSTDITVNFYNGFTVVSVVASKVDATNNTTETILASVDGPASGTLTILDGYDFTEEDIVVRFYITTADDTHGGWGLGALCDTSWTSVVELAAAASAGDNVTEMTLKEIGEAFTTAGYSAADGVVLNTWATYATLTKIEVVSLATTTTTTTPTTEPTTEPTTTTTTPTTEPTTTTTTTETTPTTGDAMDFAVLAVLAIAALGGVIAAKKARA